MNLQLFTIDLQLFTIGPESIGQSGGLRELAPTILFFDF